MTDFRETPGTPEDVAARALDNAVEVQLKLADRAEKAEAEVKRLHAALAGLFSKHASWGERVITTYLIEMIDEDGLQVCEETAAHEIIQRLADDFTAALSASAKTAEDWGE